MKRIIALLLTVCCVLPLVIGCGNVQNPDNETDTSASVTTAASSDTEAVTESPYDENGYIKDSVPDSLKYNGTKIRILRWTEAIFEEFDINETTGNAVNDSLFRKNQNVCERLGIEFEYTLSKGQNDDASIYLKAVTAAYESGEPYDLYASYSMTTPLVATYGYTQDLLNYSIIDFSKPWWPDALLTQAKINNKLYFCSGDISMNLLYMMYAVYFNKKLLSNFNLDNPYELVNSNTWTFDQLFEMCKNANVETTNSTEQQYAFTLQTNTHIDPFFYAAGLITVEQNSDGLLVLSERFSNELAIDVMAAVGNFMSQPYNSIKNGETLFAQNSALFLLHRTQYSAQFLPDVEFEYGVVPLPKYSADQQSFSTCTGFPYTMYALAEGAPHAEAAAAVLEVMASESYRTVTPEVFEVTMKTRYSLESDSGKMYDIIKDGIMFDPGRLFARNFSTLTYSMIRSTMSNNGAKNYKSLFNGNSKKLKNAIDEINACFSK